MFYALKWPKKIVNGRFCAEFGEILIYGEIQKEGHKKRAHF
jgi:hypothetical protein